MHINSLPDDVLVKVFSKIELLELLKTVRLTCIRWRWLSCDFYLWRTVDFSVYGDDDYNELVHAAMESADAIEQITEWFGLGTLFDICSKQNVYFPRLKRIELSSPYIEIRNIISAYPSLQHLNLDQPNLTLGVMQAIKKLKDIRQIEIRSSLSVSGMDMSIDSFAGFPYLHTLVLFDLGIPDYVINAVFTGSPHLKNLTLCWRNLTKNAFRGILEAGINLESLRLGQVTSLTDEDLIYIVKQMPNLRSLHFGKSRVTEKGVVYLADACRKLESLVGLELTDIGLQAIINKCPNLHKIALPGTPNLGEAGFGYMAERCRKLQQVDIEECSISDDSVLLLSTYASTLTVLRLTGINSITGQSVSQVVLNCRWLSELSLIRCCNVRNLNFDEFHQKLTPFGYKPLPECNASCVRSESEFLAPDRARDRPTHRCPVDHDTHLERRPVTSHLKTISLEGTKINNSSFMQIARHCPDLVSLVGGRGRIRDDAAAALMENCRSLRKLRIHRNQLTDTVLAQIAEFSQF